MNSEVLMSLPVGTITHNTYHRDATAGLGDGRGDGIDAIFKSVYQKKLV